MPNLRKFTLTKNRKTETWDLREDKSRQVIRSFKTKANAKKAGVLKKLLGKPGGSVKFELERGGYDEERTYPRAKNETGVRLAICDSLSLATVELLKDLGASVSESQNRKPDPGFISGPFGIWYTLSPTQRLYYFKEDKIMVNKKMLEMEYSF